MSNRRFMELRDSEITALCTCITQAIASELPVPIDSGFINLHSAKSMLYLELLHELRYRKATVE